MADTPAENQLDPVIYKPPRGWIRWTALVLALAGWWLSLDLVRLGFGRDASNPWLQAQCGATAETDQQFDCQSVLRSTWASVPLSDRPGSTRIPIAAFGMGYFAFVGLWYLFVGAPTRSRWIHHLPIALVVACGALQSWHMIEVMHAVLHKWCAGCVVVHAINGALLLLTIIAFPWTRDRAGRSPHPAGRLTLATLTACVTLFLLHPALTLVLLSNNSAGQVFRAYNEIVDDPEFVRWNYQRQPVQTIADDRPHAYLGDPDAPSTVVAFIDAQCSACMSALEIISAVIDKHPGALRAELRHFPLDLACNDSLPRGRYPGSCQAARALEAARVIAGSAGFNRLRKMLYEHRYELASARYAQWAGEIGLDEAAFTRALESDSVAAAVRADIELGRQLGVEAVPALFLNGRRLEFWRKIENWEALLYIQPDQP